MDFLIASETRSASRNERVLSLSHLHWDHEPERVQRRAGVPTARAGWKPALQDRRDACPSLGFLQSEKESA